MVAGSGRCTEGGVERVYGRVVARSSTWVHLASVTFIWLHLRQLPSFWLHLSLFCRSFVAALPDWREECQSGEKSVGGEENGGSWCWSETSDSPQEAHVALPLRLTYIQSFGI